MSRKKEFSNVKIDLSLNVDSTMMSINFYFSKNSFPKGYLFVKEIADYLFNKNEKSLFIGKNKTIFIATPAYYLSSLTITIQFKNRFITEDFQSIFTLLFESFKNFFTKNYYQLIVSEMRQQIESKMKELRASFLSTDYRWMHYLHKKEKVLIQVKEIVDSFLNDEQKLYFKLIEEL